MDIISFDPENIILFISKDGRPIEDFVEEFLNLSNLV